MWFNKSKKSAKERDEEFRFPGEERALDGHAAAYTVETMTSEAVVIQSAPDLAEITGPLRNLAPHDLEPISGQPVIIREVERLRPLAGLLAGYASAGLRASALINSLDGVGNALCATAGKRLTCVFNVTCRALPRQSSSLHGSHDDYYRAAGAGLFQLFASNAQEVADFTLIAHRVAELSLTPGICAQDLYRTTHSVQNIRVPERDLIQTYLGQPNESIATPTPAQNVLFGEHRRRIPLLVDPDRPAGIGGVQDQDSYFRALAAQRPFFSSHLEGIVDDAMREFGELTGRFYSRVTGYRTEDAEVLVVAQGAVVEELETVVDYLRAEEKIKAGVVKISAYRPFPGPDITRLLEGKSAVTVLERSDQPLAEDLPLAREIHCAVDKAIENGLTTDAGAQAHPSYATYRRLADKPRILSGIYGVGGGFPSFAELLAVFKNMLPGGGMKKCYYLGTDFDRAVTRLPHLQTMQQKLNKGYHGLEDLSLSGVEDHAAPEHPGRTIQLHALSIQGGMFAGNLFAQTLADSLDRTVRTFPQGGLDPSFQSASFTMLHADGNGTLRGKPDVSDVVLVSSHNLLEQVPARSPIKKGGTLVVETNKSPEDMWRGMSMRTADWIRKQEVRFFVVDTRKIASEAASKPSFIDQLAVWALFGAYLKTDPQLASEDVEKFLGHIRTRLGHLFGAGHYLIDDITKALTSGRDGPVELDRGFMEAEQPTTAAEVPAPWTVQEISQWDGTVFDLTRFWHSVGYFYNNGQPGQTLTDPHLATGIIPARSGAFRDMTPYRLGIPNWLPENCTGCGLCWTHCPDSALPSTIQSLSSIIRAAVTECQEKGSGMVQMQRISDNLAKQAHRLVAKDGLNQYLTVGALLRDAFSQLVEKMGLEEDKLEVLTEEFGQVCSLIEDLQVAKTKIFFDEPNEKEKGSGTLLSITLNPLSCKGCGLCVEVCPENALEWSEQTAERLEKCHRNWQLQMKLPEVENDLMQKHVTAEAHTAINRLLSKAAYNAMVGGDGASPGDGAKTAVHLLTAVIETDVRSRFKTHVDKLSSLIERLEDKIQGKVASTLEINDFESFGRRLTRMDREGLTAESLSTMIGSDATTRKADQTELKRWSDLLGQLKEQRSSYLEGAGGSGRARMAAAIDPGGGAFWSGTYPYNPHPHPWICHLPGDAPVLAEGIFEGITRKVAEEHIACRRAELELNDSYVAAEHDPFFKTFGWKDFSAEEKELVPPILVLAQAGVTDWNDISRLLSRGYPVIVAVINTHGISVTGGADGDLREEDAFSYHALAQRDVFVLQTTVGSPGHFIKGVAEGLERRRAALFHVYAPDPQLNGIAPEKVPEQARLSYQSRAFPLFKIVPDQADSMLTLDENPDVEQDWTSRELVTKEPSGIESSITTPLTVADWAVKEARFQTHFRIIPGGQLNDRMKPLAEYINLEPEKRETLEPYIELTDENQRHYLAIVSDDMARATEEQLEFWTYLRGLSGDAQPEGAAIAEAVPEPAQPKPEPQPVAAPDQAAYQKLTERLLWLCGLNRDPEFFKQSLREYITRNQKSEDNKNISSRNSSGGT